jgi:hypothetical protein
MIGKVVASGGGVSSGRNRGTIGAAGWVSSVSFRARLDEGAPDGTVWRAVVPTLPSGSASAFANKGAAATKRKGSQELPRIVSCRAFLSPRRGNCARSTTSRRRRASRRRP